MGFGLLLCGYFVITLMSFGVGDYSFAPYIIGAVIVANAALKLKAYCPRFALLIGAAGVYLVLGLFDVVVFLDELLLWNALPVSKTFTLIREYAGFIAEVFFHAALLWSVYTIATDIEEDKIRSRSIVNMVLSGVWAVGQLILTLFPAVAAFQQQFFTKLILLVILLVYVLNTLLLHACFRDICPAGEELGAPPKRSRFAFINKINDKFEEKSAKALQETLAYGEQKQKEREEKRKSKNSRRKK